VIRALWVCALYAIPLPCSSAILVFCAATSPSTDGDCLLAIRNKRRGCGREETVFGGEDDAAVRRMLERTSPRRLRGDLGCDGGAALALCRDGGAGLVLPATWMPGLSGFSKSPPAAGQGPHRRVLCLTAATRSRHLVRGSSRGPTLRRKPFAHADVVSRLRALTGAGRTAGAPRPRELCSHATGTVISGGGPPCAADRR